MNNELDLSSNQIQLTLIGGALGIGLEVVNFLTSKGAEAYMLDLLSLDDGVPADSTYIRCDIRSWADLQ